MSSRFCVVCLNKTCAIKRRAFAELKNPEGLVTHLQNVCEQLSSRQFEHYLSLYDDDLLEEHPISDTGIRDMKLLHMFLRYNRNCGHDTVFDLAFCAQGCFPDREAFIYKDTHMEMQFKNALSELLPPVIVDCVLLDFLRPFILLTVGTESSDKPANWICEDCIPEYRDRYPDATIRQLDINDLR